MNPKPMTDPINPIKVKTITTAKRHLITPFLNVWLVISFLISSVRLSKF